MEEKRRKCRVAIFFKMTTTTNLNPHEQKGGNAGQVFLFKNNHKPRMEGMRRIMMKFVCYYLKKAEESNFDSTLSKQKFVRFRTKESGEVRGFFLNFQANS
jgi:hypothetical protein